MTALDVQIAALEAHASKIDDGASRIGEVSTAALTSVALQPVAFGLMCSFLVPVVMAQQTAALAGMTALGAAVSAEGAAIKTAAVGYRIADSELAQKIAQLVGMEG